MTETSRFWNTSGVGDGPAAGYDEAAIAAVWLKLFGRGIRTSGVVRGEGNELAVTGTASPLAVASGAAIVDGIHYENDAALNVAVTTPGVGTTGGRIVLRADWSAQTVRAVMLMNTDGNPAAPALTQTPGTTYELGLYTFTITTGGVIGNLTRDPALPAGYTKLSSQFIPAMLWLAGVGILGNPTAGAAAAQLITGSSGALRRSGSSLGFGTILAAMIPNGEVGTAALGAGSADITKIGNRVLGLSGRQGGSSGAWATAGATNHTPGRVRGVVGATFISIPSSQNWRDISISLPGGIFGDVPIVLASVFGPYTKFWLLKLAATSVTQLSGQIVALPIGTNGGSAMVNWLAIGPGA